MASAACSAWLGRLFQSISKPPLVLPRSCHRFSPIRRTAASCRDRMLVEKNQGGVCVCLSFCVCAWRSRSCAPRPPSCSEFRHFSTAVFVSHNKRHSRKCSQKIWWRQRVRGAPCHRSVPAASSHAALDEQQPWNEVDLGWVSLDFYAENVSLC